MPRHERILVAVDITDESRQVVEAAAEVAPPNAEVHLLHAIEPIGSGYGSTMLPDLHAHELARLQEHATAHLAGLGKTHGGPQARQHVVHGRAITAIHRFAEDNACDLVVVGSHGRHGLGLLLGSTANGVLHGANCNVLAVRVREPDGS